MPALAETHGHRPYISNFCLWLDSSLQEDSTILLPFASKLTIVFCLVLEPVCFRTQASILPPSCSSRPLASECQSIYTSRGANIPYDVSNVSVVVQSARCEARLGLLISNDAWLPCTLTVLTNLILRSILEWVSALWNDYWPSFAKVSTSQRMSLLGQNERVLGPYLKTISRYVQSFETPAPTDDTLVCCISPRSKS